MAAKTPTTPPPPPVTYTVTIQYASGVVETRAGVGGNEAVGISTQFQTYLANPSTASAAMTWVSGEVGNLALVERVVITSP